MIFNKYVSLIIIGLLMFSIFIIIPNETDASTTITSSIKFTSINSCILDDDSFIVAFANDTDNTVGFRIYNINGTLLVNTVTVDTGIDNAGMTAVAVSALSSSSFVFVWNDKAETSVSYAIYTSSGSKVGSTVDVATDTGTSASVAVSCFNSTRFVIGYYDSLNKDITFAIYTSSGTQIKAPTDVDADVGNSWAVSVSCFNSTRFVIGFTDGTDTDATFAIYDSAGNQLKAPTDIDTDVGLSYSCSVSAYSSTSFIFAWDDYTSYDTSFAVIDSSGNIVISEVDVDTSSASAGSASSACHLANINANTFAISWIDASDATGYSRVAIYNVDGSLISSKTLASYATKATLRAIYPAGKNIATNIGLTNMFVQTWVASDTSASFEVYSANGQIYDSTYTYSITPTTPFIIRENSTRYYGFSPAIKLNNGEIIALYQNSTGHYPVGVGDLQQLRSTDGGQTWITEGQVMDDGVVSSGSLMYLNGVLVFYKHNNGDIIVYTSDDNGETWESHGSISGLTDNMPEGLSLNAVNDDEIVNGTMYIIGFDDYNGGYRNFLMSTTNGIDYNWICWLDSSVDANEATLIYLGNSHFMSISRDTDVSTTFIGHSLDMGLTWSVAPATTEFDGIAWQDPHLNWVDTGLIILHGRNYGDYSLGFMISDDFGATWSNYRLIQSYRPTSDQHHAGGYCSLVENASGNNSILLLFYSNAEPSEVEYPDIWGTWLTGGHYYNPYDIATPPDDDDDEPVTLPGSYGIGLILIILACAIPFIGFILKTLGKDD